MNNLRYVKIEGSDKEQSFEDLKTNDLFRLYEPTGVQVGDIWLALGEPYLQGTIWTIDCRPVDV